MVSEVGKSEVCQPGEVTEYLNWTFLAFLPKPVGDRRLAEIRQCLKRLRNRPLNDDVKRQVPGRNVPSAGFLQVLACLHSRNPRERVRTQTKDLMAVKQPIACTPSMSSHNVNRRLRGLGQA